MRVNSEQASVKEKDLKMGLSSNQARFLSLTSRQVDLEHRIQQICQRRLRLSSELENVATEYNNSISNRKMFTKSLSGLQNLSMNSLEKIGYKVIDNNTGELVHGLMKAVSTPSSTATTISSEADFLNLIDTINTGGAAATAALSGNYVLGCDIDLSDNGTFAKNVINGIFTGTFDGQGFSISGANISASGTDQYIGIFANNTGTIKNLQLENINVNYGNYTGATYSFVSTLAGINYGNIDNCSVNNSNITAGQNQKMVGGFVGNNNGTITNSYSDTDITVGDGSLHVGGFSGDPSSSNISTCYSTGNITAGNNCMYIGGFQGGMSEVPSSVTNSYSTGNVTVGNNCNEVAGFISETRAAGVIVTSSYATGNVVTGTGCTNVGGFAGWVNGGTTVGADNFYQNNMSTTAGSAVTTPTTATAGWNTTVWDLSGTLPVLRSEGASANLEEKLRSGSYSLVREADEFTQDPLALEGDDYEIIDWRNVPEINDELYKGDDVAAENKYDKTVEEINSQDKKLQLEQTSIEVEYKAISSERESVKKILDQNAQSSFKYFS